MNKKEEYISKSNQGECKNEGCKNKRRDKSAYCQECSDKFKKQKDEKRK